MLELATNSTVTVTSVDPNLVYGTYALVVVSMATLLVAALQNRRTQTLMAEQTKAMGKQVDQAIAQTRLQQQQIEAVLKQHGRPRVQELVQIIPSPTIRTLDLNAARGRVFPLELRNYLTLFLTDKYDERSFLVFRDFELEYKDLAGKMKRFDKEVVEPVRLRWTEFHDALLREVTDALTVIIEKYNASTQGIKPKIDNAAPTLIVDQGILPTLQGLPEQMVTPDSKQLWEGARADFLALTRRPEILARMNEWSQLPPNAPTLAKQSVRN